jgi:hypothetical protein
MMMLACTIRDRSFHSREKDDPYALWFAGIDRQEMTLCAGRRFHGP